ncbi:MAG TPA: hypothetical protein VMU94_10325 [Streptosporangiaceae bacterium]|nr:hypothetical protein [Streptosporangiaceae bacterium]
MPPFLTGSAEPLTPPPGRQGYLVPPGAPSRSDLAAAAAVAALIAQLALAQLTLVLAALFVIIGRLSRWRLLWLAWPAAAGVGWVVTIGTGRAVAGYAAAGAHLIGSLTSPGPVPARLAHLAAAFRRWRQWLPGQLPAALIVAAAEASVVGRLGRLPWRRQAGRPAVTWAGEAAGPGGTARAGDAADLGRPAWAGEAAGLAGPPWAGAGAARGGAVRPYRPGALVMARRAYLTASLRRGEVATADGGCVGIVGRTGRRASITWAEAQAGVLLTGQDAAAVTTTGLDLATAAIRHRKTVIIIDLACGAGYDAAGIVSAWRDAIGSGMRASIDSACADVQAPLLCFADPGTHYEPLSGVAPDRAADLVLAMIDWTGLAPAKQSFCADYLRTALAVSAAAGPAARPHRPVLDDLASLLRPGALQLRLRHGAATMPGHDALNRRAAELATQQETDPAAAAAVLAVVTQLAGLRSPGIGTRLGQPGLAAGAQVRLDRALAEREVVLFCLDPRMQGRPAVMVARLAVADLAGILAGRAGLGAPADCLVWINGCEAIDQAHLAALLALGPGTGTAVLLSTTAGGTAARLAGQVNVVAIRGRAPRGLAGPAGVLARPPGFPAGVLTGPPESAAGVLAGPAVPAVRPASPPGSPAAVALNQEDSQGLPTDLLAGQPPDALSLRVRSPRPRLITGCRAVR